MRLENFHEFRGFVAIRAKVFSAKFEGVVSFGAGKASNPPKFSPRKSYFSRIRESYYNCVTFYANFMNAMLEKNSCSGSCYLNKLYWSPTNVAQAINLLN